MIHITGDSDEYRVAVGPTTLKEIAANVAELSTTRESPLWHFQGLAGDSVTLSLVDIESSSFDPHLTLYNAKGIELTTSSNNSDDLRWLQCADRWFYTPRKWSLLCANRTK
ncbi:MAG: hypothetical protein R2932_03570 [Caldilineaceae bacterium]